jgi:hypothetical protein
MAGGTDTQQRVADGLYAAWKANDSGAAAQFATAEVVSKLFASGWANTDNPLGCTLKPTATLECDYATADGSVVFYVDYVNGKYLVDALGSSPY